MYLKRLWEEKISWLLLFWSGFSLIFRPGWFLFLGGVIIWILLLYFTTPSIFWNYIAMFNLNSEKAENFMRKALACQPVTPKPYIDLALIKAKKKKWDEAVALFEEASTKPGRPLSSRLKNVWAVCYREMGAYQMAVEICQQLIDEGYDNDKVYFNLALTFFYDKKLDEALKAAEKARINNITETEPVLLMGRIHFARKDYELAKDNYEWAIAHTSWPVESYYWLGRIELEQGNTDQAISHLETAVKRISDDPLLSDVSVEEAKEWLNKALSTGKQ